MHTHHHVLTTAETFLVLGVVAALVFGASVVIAWLIHLWERSHLDRIKVSDHD